MKTITTLKEALEKIEQLKSTYYFKRGSEHVFIPDSVGRELSEAMAIATGAIFPKGADAVLKIEEAEVEKVPVYKKIRAGIVSTGTEIFNGMIRNTSSVLIQGFMKEMGCESTFAGAVPDDYNKTKKMLLKACEKYDVVFTTGGVSVGERDFVADIIAEAGELLFHRAAIRPGKPLAVGIVNGTPVFALPGKPTGAFTTIEMVVRSYFTEIPRAMRRFVINEDVALPEKSFEYIFFVKIAHNTASSMGIFSVEVNMNKKEGAGYG